ncbi:sarcosine oxidase subunit gamma [Rhodobacteraceae bacterium F11138]|nr:sarcosine oxidase subunit gamma [Rhodobacteraceae bacterium F11138]
MSEPISALNHARFDGIADIAEIGLQGMITLRGDLAARAVKSAATKATGAAMPGANAISTKDDSGLCWMSPDELLVLCPYAAVPEVLAQLQTALAGSHALAVNVSDARAVFRVSGPAAREVLAKLCPVDLSPAEFEPGTIRRTRLAQVPAAFWMVDNETFQLVCFRSVAQYVFDLLCVAAQPNSEVGVF